MEKSCCPLEVYIAVRVARMGARGRRLYRVPRHARPSPQILYARDPRVSGPVSASRGVVT